MTDLEERIERIEEELGLTDDDDLPSLGGFQMVEQFDITRDFDFYLDEDGDLWIHDPDSGNRGVIYDGEVKQLYGAVIDE